MATIVGHSAKVVGIIVGIVVVVVAVVLLIVFLSSSAASVGWDRASDVPWLSHGHFVEDVVRALRAPLN